MSGRQAGSARQTGSGVWPALGIVVALAGPIGNAHGAPPIGELPRVEVISATPLPGGGVPRDQVPENVQTATDADIERRHALELGGFLNRALGSVYLNELQGNPFQPDVSYRGYTASPLLGTPQELSVYLDGVRLNQPFGDVVSWDLIPRNAIASVALMPGSNPLFGLNTLGGALVLQTKNGVRNPGSSVQASVGRFGRVALEFESGSGAADSVDAFVAGNRFHEQGWRADAPSDVQQLFGHFGLRAGGTSFGLTAALADNALTGNGVQEARALERDRSSVYSTPDRTRNRALLLIGDARGDLGRGVAFSAHASLREILTRTLNGDVNDESLTESIYQPSAAERQALAAAGYAGVPTSGASALDTPFPKWRCIANVLLNAEPNEKCNGLVNRTHTRQHTLGVGGQLSGDVEWAGVGHRWLLGAALDASRIRFRQSTQFGYLEPDRSVTGVDGRGAYADGTQASENAFDARVDLSSHSHTESVFASDTLALDPRTHLTVSGRYDRTTIHQVDGLAPGGGSGSLDGDHRFAHFNPALGLTFAAAPSLTLYGGINRGSRAPSAVELGCADPAAPCRLPNAMAGDPPLRQVVTTTFEAGLRGRVAELVTWNAGIFRADNRDDLLFVADNTSGYGYFRNFGRTRRQGLELGIAARPVKPLALRANLTWLDATYRSAETIGSPANSSNDVAAAGFPGLDGTIALRPGDRIPLVPRRLVKLGADWDIADAWRIGADLVASSGANARGNENGRHAPDGVFYTGPGRSPGYAVLNLGVDWLPARRWKVFLQIDNLLDRRYATAAQLGADAFDANGRFAARALPRNANGDYPVVHSTFYAPGAPRTATLGVRYSFDDGR